MNDLLIKENQFKEAVIAYHNTGMPTMTDQEFDILKNELIGAGSTIPELSEVGAKTVGSFTRVVHSRKMLSLDNCFTPLSLTSALQTPIIRKCKIRIEDKLDGLACSLVYMNGFLTIAGTRGDGETGEDIYSRVIHLPNVPSKLEQPISMEVRGEIVIPNNAFKELNEGRIADGQTPMKSPRNTAVGAINSSSDTLAAERGCKFIAYSLYPDDDLPIDSHSERMAYLEALGFDVVEGILVDASEVEAKGLTYANERLSASELPIDIDGIVFKVDSVTMQEELGDNGVFPTWAYAFKQNVRIVDTVINTVSWQVGRTGNITPVANLTSIFLSGADIDRATLHNYDEIVRLGINEGSTVRLIRSGQVIPKIVSVLGPHTPTNIQKPITCPECNSALQYSTVYIRCVNPKCPGILSAQFSYAASDSAVELPGVGDMIIRELVTAGKLKNLWELYTDDMAMWLAERFPETAEVRQPQFLEMIHKARHTDLYRAIMTLSIPMIAEVSAKDLAVRCKSLSDLITKSLDDLGLSGVRAQLFKEAIDNPAMQERIAKLDSLLIYNAVNTSMKLAGTRWAVSGSFEAPLSRKIIEDTITNNGGKLQSKINKSANYLVLGSGGGTKMQEAYRMRVPIIDGLGFVAVMAGYGIILGS